MLKVTPRQLHAFLTVRPLEGSYEDFVAELEDSDTPVLSENDCRLLASCDLKPVIADQYVSEHRFGGDDIASLVRESLSLVAQGYTPFVWTSKDAHLLIVGYRKDELEIK